MFIVNPSYVANGVANRMSGQWWNPDDLLAYLGDKYDT